MPALRLSNEADLRATALSVLQAYPIRYDARYQGDGVLAIQGIAPDAEQRARTGDMLRAARQAGPGRCCWPTKSASGGRRRRLAARAAGEMERAAGDHAAGRASSRPPGA